jgi:hypothetical protein
MLETILALPGHSAMNDAVDAVEMGKQTMRDEKRAKRGDGEPYRAMAALTALVPKA